MDFSTDEWPSSVHETMLVLRINGIDLNNGRYVSWAIDRTRQVAHS